MKLLSMVSTCVAYVCAGASFACNMPVIGAVWLVLGAVNHFITMW